MSDAITNQGLLDSFGHATLLFSGDNKLALYNIAAGSVLGADLNAIRSEGWSAAVQLFDVSIRTPDDSLEVARRNALTSQKPVRFSIFRNGEYVPCWASAINGQNGEVLTLITIDVPDWSLLVTVLERFRVEMRDAISSTIGHINLITRTINATDEATLKIAKRIGGFTKLIAVHMQRAERLSDLVERLEDIRTGNIRKLIQEQRGKIKLSDFIEDFLESLDTPNFLDPETEVHDYRSRIKTIITEGVMVVGSRRYLSLALQELVRNAIMYSLRGTSITIQTSIKGGSVQIDVVDEGYGIREKDFDRVFQAFERGRQPQIISEFGYGVCLHLCKSEVNAMNGKLWYTTNENVGTTFSLMLPIWSDSSSGEIPA